MSPLHHRRSERGLAAIVVSMCMVGLLVIAAMVLDFGLARVDRQINKSVADAAVAAGMHGFDQDDGQVYAFQGVCNTLGYLKTNAPALDSLPAYSPCSSIPNLAKVCTTTDNTTWASYHQSTTDGKYTVTIKAPYTLPDPLFPSDSYPGATADVADPCSQLAVIITEVRTSQVGKLATSGKIGSTIRSVGRVVAGPGNRAPALLLLDRHNCNVLSVGTSGNGNSFIHVRGAQVGSLVQPGTIHADTDGANCKSNETIYSGKIDDGIVAYAAPNLSAHGIISSYARRLGVAAAVVSDGVTRVYGSGAVDASGAASAAKDPVSGLGLITRKLVDDRYLAGLRARAASANVEFVNNDTAAHAAANGYAVLNSCTGNNQSAINALPSNTPVYVDCASYKGTGSIPATKIMFAGAIGSQAVTTLPDALDVYVQGAAGDGMDVSGGFQMHHHGASTCPNSTSNEVAHLYLRNGDIKNNNAPFRACYTSVLLFGGTSNAAACLPALGTVPAPTNTPCSGTTGNGQLALGGGGSGNTIIDWTAPNVYGSMAALTPAQKQASWDNGEDLAFWSESYGGNMNPSYVMAGGSGLHLVGVFMTPNAAPFTVTGGGGQTLNNAQYIATSFQVNGGASLDMVVDPDNTVTLPKLTYFDLVR